MGFYTKEQIKQLEDLGAVQHFNSVLDSQYKRGTSNDLDNQVADIYDAATGGKVQRTFACKTCVMNLYRNAGQLYRKTLQYFKQKQAEQQREQLRKAREAKEAKKRELSIKDNPDNTPNENNNNPQE